MTLIRALQTAAAEGKAIWACNFYNMETLRAILQAAQDTEQPVILQVSESSVRYMGLEVATAMAKAAVNAGGVRAWLHLDHAGSPGLVQECLEAGFDSVMIDASERPLKENIAVSRRVVEMAEPYKATVEAELGYVAKPGQPLDQKAFTDPGEARRFVEETGVHTLAVAIGSAHGFYKETPCLDLERLRAIRQAVADTPLVLHGSSGIPAEQIRAAVAGGIAKINLATEIKNAFMQALRKRLTAGDDIDLRRVFPAGIDAVRRLVAAKMTLTASKKG